MQNSRRTRERARWFQGNWIFSGHLQLTAFMCQPNSAHNGSRGLAMYILLKTGKAHSVGTLNPSKAQWHYKYKSIGSDVNRWTGSGLLRYDVKITNDSLNQFDDSSLRGKCNQMVLKFNGTCGVSQALFHLPLYLHSLSMFCLCEWSSEWPWCWSCLASALEDTTTVK